MKTVALKKDKTLEHFRGHSWIFSGAIETKEKITDGEIVELVDHNGNFCLLGFYSNLGSIAIRVLTYKYEPIDKNFFIKRFQRARAKREALIHNTNAYRLINGEADSIPATVVDFYNGGVVFQLGTTGMERVKSEFVYALNKVFAPSFILEKNSSAIRRSEGLRDEIVWHKRAKDNSTTITEENIKFRINFSLSQKTGFFLDQRILRREIKLITKERNVLNLFCYTGAFSISAFYGGAKKITSVDSSETAIEAAKENVSINKFKEDKFQWITEDVFNFLKECPKNQFDFIILDPPALEHKQRDQKKAINAYNYLNLEAIKLLKKPGIFITSSCSQHLTAEMIQKELQKQAHSLKLKVNILKTITNDYDHMLDIAMPETAYLKSFILWIDNY